MKRFNVTGLCIPHEHYMVDISAKLAKIKELVDGRSYFTINRARQYGKTTTLYMLEEMIKNEYTVVSISFEGLGDESFESPEAFCEAFLRKVHRALEFTDETEEYTNAWVAASVINFDLLSDHITKMCKGKRLVLMIDEVDKTSNNRVYIHFLGMLRDKFLARGMGKDHTFHSIILAGVYDIRNIKLKLINEGTYTPSPNEGKLYNSPWNIAVKFDFDMSFDPGEISTMLAQYEADHDTKMDIEAMSNEIYNYTSGYPFLVSRICECIDKELGRDWTPSGMQKAVQVLLMEKNTLFDDLIKNIKMDEKLSSFVYSIIFGNKEESYNIDNRLVDFGAMFGFIANCDGKAVISNKVFEIRFANYFISIRQREDKHPANVLRRDVIRDGRFDMELCIKKFAEHYAEIYCEKDYPFLESRGRLLFLTYLSPLINGQGFYHIESHLTDMRRMDIVVDFGQDQFIVELKIWRGEAAREDSFAQLLGYMEKKGTAEGYLLTFDFRKGKNKQTKAEWVNTGGKKIFEAVV